MEDTLKLGDSIWSENYCGFLTVVRRERQAAFLSADGQPFDWSRWHKVQDDGPVGDFVYVEVHRSSGRDSHGWVDAKSRRVVQVG